MVDLKDFYGRGFGELCAWLLLTDHSPVGLRLGENVAFSLLKKEL